jgi:hypothetical protein
MLCNNKKLVKKFLRSKSGGGDPLVERVVVFLPGQMPSSTFFQLGKNM